MRLSVIIPTLNEGHYLAAAMASVRKRATVQPPHEIIVADCGSADGTAELAARLGARVVQRDPPLDSRAAALNQGAAVAGGDVLLFLDADSTVPRGYDRAVQTALRDPHVVGGAFEFALDGPALGLRLVEIINRIRYRIWPWYYGDQGIFVRTEVFHRLRGYPNRRIMEASDFSRLLGTKGKLALLRSPMITSARRFLEGGIYRVLARDVIIWWLDLIGRPTERFAPAYQENNRRRGNPR
jgi:rSAM/selenodomain-associated transferase 2